MGRIRFGQSLSPARSGQEDGLQASARRAVWQDKLQFGELRLPGGKGPFPVVAVIHGGCWTRSFEDVTGTAPLADMLTKRGIATWNINYRARGDAGAGYPGTFEDVGAGVDHLRALASATRSTSSGWQSPGIRRALTLRSSRQAGLSSKRRSARMR
jgi:acetyl esterase/lipase